MERTREEVQRELDGAQADLETKIAQLRTVVEHVLDKPKQVLHAVEVPLTFVRAHKRFVVVVGLMAAALGTLAIGRLARHVRWR